MARPNRPFTDTIQTAKGPFRAVFEAIHEDRVFILLKAAVSKSRSPFSPGTVFVRNADLARQTNGKTEWMVYPGGLYEAWRAGGHVERNAGNLQNGEFTELLRERQAAHDYVDVIMGPEFLDPDIRDRCLKAFNVAISCLGTARDARKNLARRNFVRASQTKDALGRYNPGAAAMAAGAGIGRLMERGEELGFILRHVGLRTYRIFATIRRSMSIYEEIRRQLNSVRKGNRPYRQRLIFLVEAGDRRRALSTIQDIRGGLESIHAEPFRNNRFNASRDIKAAEEVLGDFGTQREEAAKRELEVLFARLRQGIAWVFARDFLEMQIIAPLSWLIKEVEREHRSSPVASSGVSRKDVPKPFDALADRIRDFRGRVDLYADNLLRTPVRGEVLARADEALEYVRQDDWKSVKEELQFASGIL